MMTETAARRRGRPPRPMAQAKPNDFPNSDEPIMETAEIAGVVANDRPSMRPTMRAEDPRVAAARRAAEIRGHLGDIDTGIDEFRAPKAPDGWEYEWKRKTVLGQEDPAYQVQLARMGWESVPTAAHPEEMPGRGNHPVIERKGMALMMRPAVISEEARSIDKQRAKDQVRAKEQQLNAAPDGQFERNDPRVKANIKKGYSPIAVPND